MWGEGCTGEGEGPTNNTRKRQQPGPPACCLPALFTSSNLNANETIDDLGGPLFTASSALRPAGAALSPSRQLQFPSCRCCSLCKGGRADIEGMVCVCVCACGRGGLCEVASHMDTGGVAASRQRLFPLTRDATLTCVGEAQQGNNGCGGGVGLSFQHALHLSLNHINSCQLSRMR